MFPQPFLILNASIRVCAAFPFPVFGVAWHVQLVWWSSYAPFSVGVIHQLFLAVLLEPLPENLSVCQNTSCRSSQTTFRFPLMTEFHPIQSFEHVLASPWDGVRHSVSLNSPDTTSSPFKEQMSVCFSDVRDNSRGSCLCTSVIGAMTLRLKQLRSLTTSTFSGASESFTSIKDDLGLS